MTAAPNSPAVDARVGKVADLLTEAAETHHRVYRITDGADADWASWYARWLVDLSELPEVLGRRPVPSELTCLLVELDREVSAQPPDEPWPRCYARRIVGQLTA
jgi:hypothetical protein